MKYQTYEEKISKMTDEEKREVCKTAPFPCCNGAEGCENCDFMVEDE